MATAADPACVRQQQIASLKDICQQADAAMLITG